MPGPRAPFTARHGLAVAAGCAALALTGSGLAAAPAAGVQAEAPVAATAPAFGTGQTALGLFQSSALLVVDDGALPDPTPQVATVGAIRTRSAGLEIQSALAALKVAKAERAAKVRAAVERARLVAERKNRAAARAARAALVVSPVAWYQLSAGFGDRGGWSSGRHTGLDFRAPTGTPVMAVHQGRVARTAWHPAYGRMIILDLGGGVTAWYCHLSQVSVAAGERVSAGERIGAIGMSGNTSGPHLHFEVRVWDQPTDPSAYLWGSSRGRPGAVPGWTYGTVQPFDTLGQYSF